MVAKERQRWAESYSRRYPISCGYKTACAVACLESFGISQDRFRYAQCIQDIVRVLRNNGFSVRSKDAAGMTVNKLQQRVESGDLGLGVFVVRVDRHVLLLGHKGNTIVDTDPRKRDYRKATHVYLVRRKRLDT